MIFNFNDVLYKSDRSFSSEGLHQLVRMKAEDGQICDIYHHDINVCLQNIRLPRGSLLQLALDPNPCRGAPSPAPCIHHNRHSAGVSNYHTPTHTKLKQLIQSKMCLSKDTVQCDLQPLDWLHISAINEMHRHFLHELQNTQGCIHRHPVRRI